MTEPLSTLMPRVITISKTEMQNQARCEMMTAPPSTLIPRVITAPLFKTENPTVLPPS